jgi:hypothetical protein
VSRRPGLAAGLLALALAAPLGAPAGVDAATIVIVNNDGANEGFNDPTPAAPVGGNPGTTLGQQRLFVFQHAAALWGGLLPSVVTIRVQAQFNPLTCGPTSGVLGSAGPITVHRDFPGAEVANTWYHQALANRLAGADQSGNNDINATFNSAVDDNACLGTANWYYGIDGNEGAHIELLPVVLHELGHGLGFSTQVTLSTGAELAGVPDIYERFIRDNTLGLTWDQMTAGQRASSATNTGNVAWNGPVTIAAAPCFLGSQPQMLVNSPPALPPSIAIGLASFGGALTTTGVTANVVLANDGSGTTSDACQPLVNGAALAGNIALIDRGTCSFTSKALAAQNAGALAVVIADNVASGTPLSPGGTDPSITIPVVGITQADGNAIKAQLGSGVNVTLLLNPNQLSGADAANRVLLYAPNPIQSGSSISHFDVSATPNLLMEPSITGSLSSAVDLTLAHFSDIGWRDDCVVLDCPAPVAVPRGTAVGFNVTVTNCGTSDTLHVEIVDDGGWCAPIDQLDFVANGQDLVIPVSGTAPDNCADTSVVTVVVKTRAGLMETCTTTLTTFNSPPEARCRNLVVAGTGGAGCTVAVSAAQVDSGSSDPDGTGLTLQLLPPGPFGEGATPVVLLVTDDCGASDTCQAVVTVTCPAPLLVVEPGSIGLGTVAAGDTACSVLALINAGTDTLDIASVTGCDAGRFALDLSLFDATVPPGDTTLVTVCYSPDGVGSDSCDVAIVSNGGNASIPVAAVPSSSVGGGRDGRVLVVSPVMPTPFSGAAVVRFSIDGPDEVGAAVFDAQGRLVRTLLGATPRGAGTHTLEWDGRDDGGRPVAAGVFYVRVTTAAHGERIVRAIRVGR